MEETAQLGHPHLRRVVIDGRARLATRSLAPSKSVYGERVVHIAGHEFRLWDSYRSKLAAALVKGLRELPLPLGSRVLYLGASTGTTVSHISDLLGSAGLVYAVEHAPRVARELIERVARHRSNVIPIIADARHPDRYQGLSTPVDVVYCDIAQPDQTEICLLNCAQHLRPRGHVLLIVKSRSIDVVRRPAEIYREEQGKLRAASYELRQVLVLAPFDRDHALLHAVKPG